MHLRLRVSGWTTSFTEWIYNFVYTPACWKACSIIGMVCLVVALFGGILMGLNYGNSLQVLRLFKWGEELLFLGGAVGWTMFMLRWAWKHDSYNKT